MKVGEGDGGATLSLKERAEKYHKKREHMSPLHVLSRHWSISPPSVLSVSGLDVWECGLSGIKC